MEPIKAFIQKAKDKLAYMEMSDLFPYNRKCDIRDKRSVLFFTGIYLGVLILCALLFVLGTTVPVYIGWLLILIGCVAGVYAVASMLHVLFQFMKYNG